MKKVIITLVTIVFLGIVGYSQINSVADSARSNKVKEPEYNDIFVLLDTASGNLTDLERQTLKVKVHPHGFGGAESDLDLKGGKSPIRFKKGETLEFIVRVSSPQTDPHGYILLYSLESKKNQRALEVAKAGYAGIGSKTVLDKSAIAFTATRYGVSSFKIKAIQDLPPGEYLLLTKDAKDGFAFGID